MHQKKFHLTTTNPTYNINTLPNSNYTSFYFDTCCLTEYKKLCKISDFYPKENIYPIDKSLAHHMDVNGVFNIVPNTTLKETINQKEIVFLSANILSPENWIEYLIPENIETHINKLENIFLSKLNCKQWVHNFIPTLSFYTIFISLYDGNFGRRYFKIMNSRATNKENHKLLNDLKIEVFDFIKTIIQKKSKHANSITDMLHLAQATQSCFSYFVTNDKRIINASISLKQLGLYPEIISEEKYKKMFELKQVLLPKKIY